MKTRPSTYLHCRALSGAVLTLLCCSASWPASAEILEGEVSGFVRGYLQAAQQATPDAEVDYYADRVRYFDDGTVDRNFIAQDQRRYYARWPERFFELLDGPVITSGDADSATVKFTIRYQV